MTWLVPLCPVSPRVTTGDVYWLLTVYMLCFLYELEVQEGSMDQPSGRSFMQVLCEKYSPENFPYRRGPGMGVHVPATPQGSPMKGGVLVSSLFLLMLKDELP